MHLVKYVPLAILYMLFSCTVPPASSSVPASSNVVLLSAGETVSLREFTLSNCGFLVNQSIAVSGTVLFEECGKNGLGGFPNSGPSYCYYGVHAAYPSGKGYDVDCTFYVASRVTSFMNAPEEHFNVFTEGQVVELRGVVTYYDATMMPSYPRPAYLIVGKRI